MHEQNKMPIPG